jgi:hypothetical protein
MTKEVACPFIYANGRKCPGHIIRVEAYKADITWTPGEDGKWRPSVGEPRSHYHLFCSEKGNHVGARGEDHPRMKCYLGQLPEGLCLLD